MSRNDERDRRGGGTRPREAETREKTKAQQEAAKAAEEGFKRLSAIDFYAQLDLEADDFPERALRSNLWVLASTDNDGLKVAAAAVPGRIGRVLARLLRGRLHSEHNVVARTVFQSLKLRNAQLWAFIALTRFNSRKLGLSEERSSQARAIPSGARRGIHRLLGLSVSGRRSSATDALANSADLSESAIVTRIRAKALAEHFYDLRDYHLAVTDLFVEKAIEYLDRQANRYRLWGITANIAALIVISAGAGFAGMAYLNEAPRQADPIAVAVTKLAEAIAQTKGVSTGPSAFEFFRTFLIGFTFFGMVVLLAVGLRRFGRAMLDQSERLAERRHALRQGRLFVHLNDGILTVDEMERIFNWNAAGANAFGSMQTEDQAPSGAVLRELAHQAPKMVEALQASRRKD